MLFMVCYPFWFSFVCESIPWDEERAMRANRHKKRPVEVKGKGPPPPVHSFGVLRRRVRWPGTVITRALQRGATRGGWIASFTSLSGCICFCGTILLLQAFTRLTVDMGLFPPFTDTNSQWALELLTRSLLYLVGVSLYFQWAYTYALRKRRESRLSRGSIAVRGRQSINPAMLPPIRSRQPSTVVEDIEDEHQMKRRRRASVMDADVVKATVPRRLSRFSLGEAAVVGGVTEDLEEASTSSESEDVDIALGVNAKARKDAAMDVNKTAKMSMVSTVSSRGPVKKVSTSVAATRRVTGNLEGAQKAPRSVSNYDTTIEEAGEEVYENTASENNSSRKTSEDAQEEQPRREEATLQHNRVVNFAEESAGSQRRSTAQDSESSHNAHSSLTGEPTPTPETPAPVRPLTLAVATEANRLRSIIAAGDLATALQTTWLQGYRHTMAWIAGIFGSCTAILPLAAALLYSTSGLAVQAAVGINGIMLVTAGCAAMFIDDFRDRRFAFRAMLLGRIPGERDSYRSWAYLIVLVLAQQAMIPMLVSGYTYLAALTQGDGTLQSKMYIQLPFAGQDISYYESYQAGLAVAVIYLSGGALITFCELIAGRAIWTRPEEGYDDTGAISALTFPLRLAMDWFATASILVLLGMETSDMYQARRRNTFGIYVDVTEKRSLSLSFWCAAIVLPFVRVLLDFVWGGRPWSIWRLCKSGAHGDHRQIVPQGLEVLFKNARAGSIAAASTRAGSFFAGNDPSSLGEDGGIAQTTIVTADTRTLPLELMDNLEVHGKVAIAKNPYNEATLNHGRYLVDFGRELTGRCLHFERNTASEITSLIVVVVMLLIGQYLRQPANAFWTSGAITANVCKVENWNETDTVSIVTLNDTTLVLPALSDPSVAAMGCVGSDDPSTLTRSDPMQDVLFAIATLGIATCLFRMGANVAIESQVDRYLRKARVFLGGRKYCQMEMEDRASIAKEAGSTDNAGMDAPAAETHRKRFTIHYRFFKDIENLSPDKDALLVASEELMEMTKQRYILRSLGVALQGAYVRESKLRRESRDPAARSRRGSRSSRVAPMPTASDKAAAAQRSQKEKSRKVTVSAGWLLWNRFGLYFVISSVYVATHMVRPILLSYLARLE